MVKGNTIEELASNAGIDGKMLQKTLDSYNGYCAEGVDPFGKRSEYLFEMSEGPYYLVDTEAGILATMGGVKVNSDLEAITDDCQPIKGLYAAGNDAGGLFGDMYVMVEGFSLGFAYNSGRISGENAVSYIESL